MSCDKSQYNGSLFIELAMDWSFNMDKPRPYVTAALLCERVLQEKDESLTVVRIIDKIQYRVLGNALPEGTKPLISLQGLVGIKSGSAVGNHTIKIIGEKPSGERKDVYSVSVEFLGKDHGRNLIMSLNIGIDENGLYWFDVLFDDEVLTRIPLIVTPLEESLPQEQMTT